MIPDKLNICAPRFSKAAGPSPGWFHVRRVCGGGPGAAQGNLRRLRAGLAAGGAGPHQEDAPRHKGTRPGCRRGILEWCWFWTCGFTCFSNRSNPNMCTPHSPPLPSPAFSFLGMCIIKANSPGLSPLAACAGQRAVGGRGPPSWEAKGRLPDLLPGLPRAAGCLRPRRHRGNLASALASAQPSRWRRTPPSPPLDPPNASRSRRQTGGRESRPRSGAPNRDSSEEANV